MKDFDLFAGERALIETAQNALTTDAFPDAAGRRHFETLLKDYEKLLKQFRRLIRMSDRNEAELNRLTKSLEAQAVDLKDARDTAEAATRAKDTFLATMSHEIRTPMNGVVGMIDLLHETRLDGDQRQMLGVVRDSAFSLLTIINDILDFSKIEAGKLELENIPISVNDVVDGVAETLRPNAAKKDLLLMAYVDPTIPQTVLGDQVRIRQVLFNLAGNAIKFTRNRDGFRGKVVVRADRVGDADDTGVTVRYAVTDNGIGISEEAQKSFFEEFTQAESSTTRQFGGTGLGLSICQRLTELMHGSIAVESTLGVGSTFSATIRHDPADDGAIQDSGHDISDLDVLLVSDVAETVEFLSDYLRHGKARTTSAGAASAAGAAMAAPTIDVVVMAADIDETVGEELNSAIAGREKPTGAAFVMLSSDQRTGPREIADGILSIAADPVRRGDFVAAVAIAAGRTVLDQIADDKAVDGPIVRAPSIEEAEAQGRLILVADDNSTNRDVIRRQLNVLGYAADIVEDGSQALDAWRAKTYAILLTDCQMPEMDGFELTSAIRAAEDETESHLPIVAITANALAGEADRCLAAGMDDYLSKPVEMDKLRQTLSRWMPVGAVDRPAAIPAAIKDEIGPFAAGQVGVVVRDSDTRDDPAGSIVEETGTAVDIGALRSLFGDDDDEIREIFAAFVEPTEATVAEILDAVAGQSATDVASQAHKLKSSSRAIGAHNLADLCVALEDAGKEEDWSTIGAVAPQLDGALQAVRSFVEAF